MTYSEAIQHLLELTLFGSKLGLDNPRRLAALAGSPHERLRFIHVAGTNGKGSVCAMLESIYREAGLRTGLFTSPHLVSFRERMQVNRELIPEGALARLTAQLRDSAAGFPEGQGPTFFEVAVVMALCHFAEQSCDIVLWETAEGAGQAATTSPISLGDVIASLVIGAVTFLLASNLPGLLEVLVLSRMDLRQGTSYATTTLLSYVIVASGIMLTLGALGLSWDKMQWLVAALGVGLGFGLQEIFANFISGIILLFERPIRIGDVITINNLDGTVSRIRIRATTLIDFDRKEILVPNKVFVTERLINWSLSDTVTRIIIKVGFAYGSDLQKCRDILMQAARENKRVLRDPEPVVFFLSFGASTLDHELRVHVNDIGDRLAATDELNRHIDALCKEHDIEIAFSQLDIHIRNGDGDKLCIEGEKKEKSVQQDDKGQAPKASDGEHNESNDPR